MADRLLLESGDLLLLETGDMLELEAEGNGNGIIPVFMRYYRGLRFVVVVWLLCSL